MSDCRYGDNCFACKKADCVMEGAKLQLSLRKTDDPSVLGCSPKEETVCAEVGRAILKWVYLMKKELRT